MRLVTYSDGGASRCGLLSDGRVHDAKALARAVGVDEAVAATVRHLLETDEATRAAIAGALVESEGVALDEVTLRAPIENPDKIICLGLNYRDHAEESGLALPAAPMLFAKYRNSLAGPADPIVLPPVGEKFDYEAELAIVIGTTARQVDEADALDYVAGVMALNDVTARDIQHATTQWLAGKAIDTFAPCGPALVTMDEIDDVQDLTVRARVNGRLVQDGNTRNMIFSVAETIAFVSQLMTLVPGDIISTGTPSGVGISRDPQVLLGDGDVVEVEIGGVGLISNRVTATDRTTTGRTAATSAA